MGSERGLLELDLAGTVLRGLAIRNPVRPTSYLPPDLGRVCPATYRRAAESR